MGEVSCILLSTSTSRWYASLIRYLFNAHAQTTNFYNQWWLGDETIKSNHSWNFHDNQLKTQRVTAINVYLLYFLGVPSLMLQTKKSYFQTFVLIRFLAYFTEIIWTLNQYLFGKSRFRIEKTRKIYSKLRWSGFGLSCLD